ncbi:MAG: cyclic-di-AMP receptor [Anaerolineales bacterium]|nr:cyclic-di-AMP receptor [Anaerolineales bacterium]
MKLILAVVRDLDGEAVIDTLLSQGYRVTRLASTGGFLRRGNITLMIGVEENQVQDVIQQLKAVVGPPEKEQHRVTLFVINAIDFEQI